MDQKDRRKITWEIHYACNYRCPYCWFCGEGWKVYGQLNTYLSTAEWVRHWDRLYSQYGSLFIDITGGEPFLYPDFVSLIEQLSQKNTVRITTNLSQRVDDFVKYVKPDKVLITASLHPLFADLSVFLEKCLLLKENNFPVNVSYVAYPKQMSLIPSYNKLFEKEGIPFHVTAFWGTYQGRTYPGSYSSKERPLIEAYLDSQNKKEYTLEKTSPKGKSCRAGEVYAIVRGDGRVNRCGRSLEETIGSIFDDGFKFLEQPYVCEAEYCPCNEQIFV